MYADYEDGGSEADTKAAAEVGRLKRHGDIRGSAHPACQLVAPAILGRPAQPTSGAVAAGQGFCAVVPCAADTQHGEVTGRRDGRRAGRRSWRGCGTVRPIGGSPGSRPRRTGRAPPRPRPPLKPASAPRSHRGSAGRQSRFDPPDAGRPGILPTPVPLNPFLLITFADMPQPGPVPRMSVPRHHHWRTRRYRWTRRAGDPTVLLEGLVQRDESLLEPEDGRLGTVGEVQPGEDARHVRLDRLLGDGEGTGDLPVGPAAGQ